MIPRDPKVSRQEFHDHWRHPHASLGRDIGGLGDLVQSHQFDSPHLGTDQAYFEGIGEAWFPSVSVAQGMAEDPTYKNEVQPDEVNFIDLGRLDYLFCDEEVIVDRATLEDGVRPVDARWSERARPTSIKLIQFIRQDGDKGWASDEDRALGLRVGALRHVRAWPIDGANGDAPRYRGVRELWWPTAWDFEQGIERDGAAWERLRSAGGDNALTLIAVAERWPDHAAE
jgi:hypothetical protein